MSPIVRQTLISGLSSLLLLAPVAYVPALLSAEPAASQTQSLTLGQIRQKASRFTVKVKVKRGQGSGILIGKSGQTYTVVTNAHVVDRGQPYQIQTADGKVYTARLKSSGKTYAGKDLALLEFQSGVTYSVATLQNAVATKNEMVFAVGFSVESPQMQVLSGKVKLTSEKPLVGGYQIGFTSSTEQGMSGGALLNASGQVIGVLGQGNFPILNNSYVYEDGSSPNENLLQQLRSVSLAVPIAAVQQLVTQAIINPTNPAAATKPPQAVSDKYTGILAKVDEVAQQITMKIEGTGTFGSGVIVAKQGDVYYVLTAAHVVTVYGDVKVLRKDQYTVITPDGERHEVHFADIKLSGVDLAVVPFTSTRSYPLAKLAPQARQRKEVVFVSGFPLQSNPERGSLNRILTTGTKKEEERNDFAVKDASSLQIGNGFEMVYSNLSYPGMSGGPVLDVQGRVVGINNASEADLYKQANEKTDIYIGYSLGVPIRTFVGVASRANINPNSFLIDTTPATQPSSEDRASIRKQLLPNTPPSNNSSALDWLNYGIQFWRLGETEQAIAAFDQAIKLQPNLYLAYFAKGLSVDSDTEALANFQRATQLNPSYAPAWIKLGDVLIVLSRYSESLNAYEQAIKNSTNKSDIHLYWSKATALNSLGHFSEAITILDEALKIKEHPWLYLQRGTNYQSLGSIDKAFSDFSKVIELQPNNENAYAFRANNYYILKDFTKALVDINKSIEINPSASSYYTRGNIYIQLNEQAKARLDHTKAVMEYSKMIEDYPIRVQNYISRAASYIALNDYSKAIMDYSKAIEINPNVASIYWSRGFVYDNLKDYQKAIIDFSKAIEIDPTSSIAYSFRAKIYSSLKEYVKAIADYTKRIDLNPNTIDPIYINDYVFRGDAYRNLKDNIHANADYNKAIAAFTKAIESYPNGAGYFEGRASIYRILGENNKAIADLTTAIKINPHNVLNYDARALIYLDFKEYDKVIIDCTRSIEIDANHWFAYDLRSYAYSELKDYQKAVSGYTKVLEFSSKLTELTELTGNQKSQYTKNYEAGILSKRGLVYIQLKDYPRAIADFTKSIEINPNNANSYINRGEAYVALKDYGKALVDYSKAIELNPDNANLYFGRSSAYLAQRNYESALADCNRALTKEPKFPAAKINIGLIKYEQGYVEEAIAQWNQAIAIDNGLPEPQFALAVALFRKGDSEKGVMFAEKALKLDRKLGDLAYLKENLWGDRLVADAKKFLDSPQMQALLSKRS